MKIELQKLFDKGYRSLSYQLEAMYEKAPELEDDFDNLLTVVSDHLEELEERAEYSYDQGRDEGFSEGYSEAEWELDGRISDAYEEGRQEGYEDGFSEGEAVGFERASQEEFID